MLENKDALLIYANQRSGHHAILNWIAEQHPYNCIHHNDVLLSAFYNGTIKYRGDKGKKIYRNKFFSLQKLLIFNFENTSLESSSAILKSPILSKKLVYEITVLRDFYNNMASVIKSTKREELIDKLRLHKRIWVNLAENYLEDNIYGILYNKWYKEKSYRKKICHQFGLNFTDEGYEKIQPFGGGSSFSEKKFTPLGRYKNFINNKLFLDIVDSEKIHSLNEEIFGWNLKDEIKVDVD